MFYYWVLPLFHCELAFTVLQPRLKHEHEKDELAFAINGARRCNSFSKSESSADSTAISNDQKPTFMSFSATDLFLNMLGLLLLC